MSLFSFFHKPSTTPFPFHVLKTDLHAHLIPGVDDGSPDAETSVALIKGLVELGYENFTATPHVMEDIWRNNTESIMAGFALLQQALGEHQIHHPVRPAAEYLVDGNFEDLLAAKVPLLTIRDNWVLFEISFVQPPRQLKEVIFEMQMQGYQPVLAHPERYAFFQTEKSLFDDIKNAGCLLQSNLLSFAGYYGPEIKKFAEKLATKGWVDLLGTDLHHERHLLALRDLKLTSPLATALEHIQN